MDGSLDDDVASGGAGEDAIQGSSGDDRIEAVDGERDQVLCSLDTVAPDCEKVDVAAAP